MPIRPENKARYPKDWSAISKRIRARAGNCCECEGECGTAHDPRCEAINGDAHPLTGSRVVLTTAHMNHMPEDCDDRNLKAMCQKCHNMYDAPMRRKGIHERARAVRAAGDLFDGTAE